ncbi:hypothetical protein Rhe02_92660 [Rhizocola hellebori]|uniref:Uncharacterized protein n=1 Tax=Rhizocola hellebori TaxID=1392758 RepID=A0A8J3VL69_9ACTN|nr:hypothetical protein [Rhizocola hellebori]GIH11199.1 hypothetical protein Rhe02_92660 [Rhizocola hellebori]
MTRLEERYRRVLRLLPASYREVWEEDMVSTFLATVETDDREQAEYLADYGRPGWDEVASIVALAIRLRFASSGAPPRYATWAEAIRLAALAGLLVNAAASTVVLVLTLWRAGMIPLIPAPAPLPEPPGYPAAWHRLFMLAALAGLLWLPAFLALVLGRRAMARWLALAAVLAAILSTAATVAFAQQLLTGELCYGLLIDAVLVLALTTFTRGAAPVQYRSWLLAFVLGTAVIAAYSLVLFQPTTPFPPLDWAGLECVMLVTAAAVHISVIATRRQLRIVAWTPALAILAFVVLGLRLVSLSDYSRFGSSGWHPATVPLGIAEAVVVGATAIVLVLLSARTLRRLPATGADATAWSTSSR